MNKYWQTTVNVCYWSLCCFKNCSYHYYYFYFKLIIRYPILANNVKFDLFRLELFKFCTINITTTTITISFKLVINGQITAINAKLCYISLYCLEKLCTIVTTTTVVSFKLATRDQILANNYWFVLFKFVLFEFCTTNTPTSTTTTTTIAILISFKPQIRNQKRQEMLSSAI